MLGSPQMAAILTEAKRAGAKVVAVGDPEQLQAIAAGAAFRAIAEELGFAEITTVKRQREIWQQEATRNFAMQKTQEALEVYINHQHVHRFVNQETAINAMINRWDETRRSTPEKSQILLAYRRDEVALINERVRLLRQERNELDQGFEFKTAKEKQVFAKNERIYFLQNENMNLKVKNGTLGTIQKIKGSMFTVKLDRNDEGVSRTVKFDINDYNHIDHGYAATIHKAQGITVDHAHVLASPLFDRHTTYVAMTRHRDRATLYYAEEKFKNDSQLIQRCSRERSKDITLDYTKGKPIQNIRKNLFFRENNYQQSPAYNSQNKNISHPSRIDNHALPSEKSHSIDWYDPKYQEDWKQLRAMTNNKVQWMVKFYDLGLQKRDYQTFKSVNKKITEISQKLAVSKDLVEIQKKAPQLSKAMMFKCKEPAHYHEH